MARDYLAIPGLSVDSNQVLSNAGHTKSALRNRLRPETLEGLQMLKDGYRTGVLKAQG